MQDIITNCYDNNIEFYFLFDLTNVKFLDITGIKKFINLFKYNEKAFKIVLKESIICNGGLLTNLFSNIVFSIYTPIKPTHFLKDYKTSINYINSIG